MRYWVGASLVFLAGACGQVGGDGTTRAAGGEGSGGTAGSNAAAAGSAASGLPGTEADNGGNAAATSSGGNAAATSGGGQNSVAGSAGAAGEGLAGAASNCDGNYLACGCGCCLGASPAATCYYPELGDDLSSIIRADETQRRQASCATQGCSVGLNYACCTTPTLNPNEGAAYSATLYVGGFDHLSLSKTAGQVCGTFGVLRPAVGPSKFRIEVPEGWRADVATLRTCQASGSTPLGLAIGGLGSLKLRVVGATCVIDADLTLFYASSPAPVESVRFNATSVPVDIPVSQCL